MLFISNNKKIDAVIKRLQPKLKLKINIERDYDCGLNDVFEKRPDVVFIQNQIAGVTGESVARHIQLLLGGAAPKFIFIHDGDAKAKPKKGVYEYLIDLSQDDVAVAADILEKLTLLLGPQWQNVFVASVLQGVDYEAYIPPPEAPIDAFAPCFLEDVPAAETFEPVSPPLVSPLLPLSGIAQDETFAVIPATFGQGSESLYEECRVSDPMDADVSGRSASAEGTLPSSEYLIPAPDSELSAVSTEKLKSAVVSSVTGANISSVLTESSSPLRNIELTKDARIDTGSTDPVAEKQQPRSGSFAGRGAIVDEMPLSIAQEEIPWAFEGEPSLKKATWKWYQVVELVLVLCLLVGGWYFIKQKPKPLGSAPEEVNLIASAASPPITQPSVPVVQPPQTDALPSFIPASGIDAAFPTQNPGWERYIGAGADFHLFRENGKLKAVQIKADKGHVISDALLKSILVELVGTGEYRVTSHGKKLGFHLTNATVPGKAELQFYRKKTALRAVVVSLE